MSPGEAGLIAYSWKRVGPVADRAAGLFYDCLFDIAPATRANFAADQMPWLRRDLISGIDAAVAELAGPAQPRHLRPAPPPARDLLLGAEAPAAVDALASALATVLGRDWTPEHDTAWRAAGPHIVSALRPAPRAA